MPNTRNLRRSLFIVGLALATQVHARPPNEVTTEYFSDATHSRLVGESILSCSGGVRKWGRTTNFTLKSSDACGKTVRTDRMQAAHLLLHHDPAAACRLRCDSRFPPRTCAPDEDCGLQRRECVEACNLFMTPEDDSP